MVKPDDLPAVNGSVQNTGGMTCLSENVIIPPNVCSEGRSHDNAPHDKQKVLLPLRFAQSDAQSDTARLRNTESTPNFSRVLPKRPWLHRRAHTSHAIMSIPGAPIGAACTYETSGVKKWDPTTRDSSAWDSLRRVSNEATNAKNPCIYRMLIDTRTKNCGLQMAIAPCIYTAQENQEEDLHSGFLLRC